ncbi:MAG: glutaminyl-peptide cyclotransferase [Gaiellales bacterium]
MIRRAVVLAGLLLLMTAVGASAAPTLGWALVAAHPHDPTAFTEGLVARGGVLLESTGLEGQSTVRRVDPATGTVLLQQALAPSLFGEGLTVLKGTAIQLTWNDHRIFSYDPSTLARTSARRYPFVGWGLTTDGRQLIASDGTSTVRWLDPATLKVGRRITVRDGEREVDQLNELELIDGVLWANVWHSDRIALIDPADGHVRAWLDMTRLRAQLSAPGEVLNGIARYPGTADVAVTGKDWPQLFQIRLAGRIPA